MRKPRNYDTLILFAYLHFGILDASKSDFFLFLLRRKISYLIKGATLVCSLGVEGKINIAGFFLRKG